MTTKIAFVSDTHGFEGVLNIPKCDVLVHCGDVCSGFGELMAIENIAYWFEQLKKEDIVQEVILVAGNHDTNFLSKPEMSKALLKRGCHFLQNEELIIDDVKFYGTMFLDIVRNDSLLLKVEEIIDSRVEFYEGIPKDTDVLITHQPPDLVPLSLTEDGFNLGCPILRKATEKIKPIAHAFGHCHRGYGIRIQNGIKYINASIGHGEREIPTITI